MNELSHERLTELLDYNAETGVFTWKVAATRSIKIGAVAGCDKGRGYWGIQIDGKQYFAHRLAWLYIHGSWPEECIDHINGVKGDNRIANLREATRAQNQYNIGVRAKNTSGFKGVTWKKPLEKWQANIKYKGKTHHIGYFETPEAAHTAYCRAADDLHKDFANYGEVEPIV